MLLSKVGRLLCCNWLRNVMKNKRIGHRKHGQNRGAHRIFFQGVIGGRRGQWLGGTMASAEHEPITGVWWAEPGDR